MNIAQRNTIVLASIAALTILFLHNPTGGYAWQEEQTSFRYTGKPTSACDGERLEALINTSRRLTLDEILEKDRLLQQCHPGESIREEVTLPLSDWRSQSAVLPWFASVANVLWLLVTVFMAAAVCFYVYRPQHPPPE